MYNQNKQRNKQKPLQISIAFTNDFGELINRDDDEREKKNNNRLLGLRKNLKKKSRPQPTPLNEKKRHQNWLL